MSSGCEPGKEAKGRLAKTSPPRKNGKHVLWGTHLLESGKKKLRN